MGIELTIAVISFLSAIIVVLVSEYYKVRISRKRDSKQINDEFLNPLRLYLEENYFRLEEIVEKSENSKEAGIQSLLFIKHPEDLSSKELNWFASNGVYLISSCYLTSCLFALMFQVRENLSYIKLRSGNDTILINLIFRVNHAFLQNHGIYYIIQQNIGQNMIDNNSPVDYRLLSYSKFCQKLKDEDERIWFEQLIDFYIELGKGYRIDQVKHILSSIKNLSDFLEKHLKGGPSINERLEAEGKI